MMTKFVSMVQEIFGANSPDDDATAANEKLPVVTLSFSYVRMKNVYALKEWTGKSKMTTIYDSTVDEFTDDSLFSKIRGKRNIAVIGFTTDGDVFGGYYSVAVTKLEEEFHDPNMFVFSFESHERCETPQRFVMKKKRKEVWVKCFNNWRWGCIIFRAGDGLLWLGNERSDSLCSDLSKGFKGLKSTTLSGKNNGGDSNNGEFHHCTRLIAVQFS